jgi:hypothetical protein
VIDIHYDSRRDSAAHSRPGSPGGKDLGFFANYHNHSSDNNFSTSDYSVAAAMSDVQRSEANSTIAEPGSSPNVDDFLAADLHTEGHVDSTWLQSYATTSTMERLVNHSTLGGLNISHNPGNYNVSYSTIPHSFATTAVGSPPSQSPVTVNANLDSFHLADIGAATSDLYRFAQQSQAIQRNNQPAYDDKLRAQQMQYQQLVSSVPPVSSAGVFEPRPHEGSRMLKNLNRISALQAQLSNAQNFNDASNQEILEQANLIIQQFSGGINESLNSNNHNNNNTDNNLNYNNSSFLQFNSSRRNSLLSNNYISNNPVNHNQFDAPQPRLTNSHSVLSAVDALSYELDADLGKPFDFTPLPRGRSSTVDTIRTISAPVHSNSIPRRGSASSRLSGMSSLSSRRKSENLSGNSSSPNSTGLINNYFYNNTHSNNTAPHLRDESLPFARSVTVPLSNDGLITPLPAQIATGIGSSHNFAPTLASVRRGPRSKRDSGNYSVATASTANSVTTPSSTVISPPSFAGRIVSSPAVFPTVNISPQSINNHRVTIATPTPNNSTSHSPGNKALASKLRKARRSSTNTMNNGYPYPTMALNSANLVPAVVGIPVSNAVTNNNLAPAHSPTLATAAETLSKKQKRRHSENLKHYNPINSMLYPVVSQAVVAAHSSSTRSSITPPANLLIPSTTHPAALSQPRLSLSQSHYVTTAIPSANNSSIPSNNNSPPSIYSDISQAHSRSSSVSNIALNSFNIGNGHSPLVPTLAHVSGHENQH